MFELPHRRDEGGLEFYGVGVGEKQNRPEAVGEFVRERGVEIFGGAQAFLGHDEFHEIADVADKTLGEFGRTPGPRAGGEGPGGIKFADTAGARGELREGPSGSGHRVISRAWR